jgi:hypothetical protein
MNTHVWWGVTQDCSLTNQNMFRALADCIAQDYCSIISYSLSCGPNPHASRKVWIFITSHSKKWQMGGMSQKGEWSQNKSILWFIPQLNNSWIRFLKIVLPWTGLTKYSNRSFEHLNTVVNCLTLWLGRLFYKWKGHDCFNILITNILAIQVGLNSPLKNIAVAWL